MNKVKLFAPGALALVAFAGWGSAQAEDAKPAEKHAETKYEDKGEKDFGDKFTSFWIHDVGGTIHNGLKKGTSKIEDTFTGGGKEREVANKRHKIAQMKQNAKTEVEKAKADEEEAKLNAQLAEDERKRVEKEKEKEAKGK